MRQEKTRRKFNKEFKLEAVQLSRQPGMTAAKAVADPGGPRMAAFFEKCEKTIPWREPAAAVKDVVDDSKPDQGGRPLGRSGGSPTSHGATPRGTHPR